MILLLTAIVLTLSLHGSYSEDLPLPGWRKGTDSEFGKLPVLEKEPEIGFNMPLLPVWRQGTDYQFGKLPIVEEEPDIAFNMPWLPVETVDEGFKKSPASVGDEHTIFRRQLEPAWRQNTDFRFGKVPIIEEEPDIGFNMPWLPVEGQIIDEGFQKSPVSVENEPKISFNMQWLPVESQGIDDSFKRAPAVEEEPDISFRMLWLPIEGPGIDDGFKKSPIFEEEPDISFRMQWLPVGQMDDTENSNGGLQPAWRQGTDSAFGKLPIVP